MRQITVSQAWRDNGKSGLFAVHIEVELQLEASSVKSYLRLSLAHLDGVHVLKDKEAGMSIGHQNVRRTKIRWQ